MNYTRLLGERYTPLYFLNALVAGGFAISFYMYLYWLCKLELSSLPSFSTLWDLFSRQSIPMRAGAALFLAGFATFTVIHVRQLIWNLRNFAAWRSMVPYKALMTSKDKTVLLTIPATVAISVTLLLMLGLIVLPFGLRLKAFAFPFVFLGMAYVTGKSLPLYAAILLHRLDEDNTTNGFSSNLGQMVAILSLALQALPFALIGQNTDQTWLLLLSCLTSGVLLGFAITLGIVRFLPLLLRTQEGPVPAEASPLFWFATGLLSILFLVAFQIDGSLSRAFTIAQSPASIMVACIILLCFGSIAGLTGKTLMQRHALLVPLLQGNLYSPGLYGVLCPMLGIGLIYGYFLNIVLINAGLFTAFSLGHLIGYMPLVVLHVWAIRIHNAMNRKLFGARPVTKKIVKKNP